MRVICIDGSDHDFSVKEGEVYTVEYSMNSHCGRPSYKLKELNYWGNTICVCGCNNNAEIYRKERFISLSEIDETELVNKKQDVCV